MFRWLLTKAQKEELKAQAIAYARTAEFRQARDRALKAGVVEAMRARLGPKSVYVLEWRYGMISEVRGVFSTPEGAWGHASRKEDPAYLVHKFDLDQGTQGGGLRQGVSAEGPVPLGGGGSGLGVPAGDLAGPVLESGGRDDAVARGQRPAPGRESEVGG